MTEFMALSEKVSKFNQEAKKHIERQTLNPFSGGFSRSPSPRPKFGKDEYGKPAAGSKTEMRGQRAHTQISREILELCTVIHDMGVRRRDSDGDENIIIPFGELFAFYTKISDKVVGLLIAAKKRGFVWFEPEILFQRRDDDVLIALLKPVGEIRNIINRQISGSPSPAPSTTAEPEKPSATTTPSPLARKESSTPREASPAKPSPKEASPKATSPKEASPKEASPKEATPEEATPKEASPEEATPKESTPKEASPVKSSPSEVAPAVPEKSDSSPTPATSEVDTAASSSTAESVPQEPSSTTETAPTSSTPETSVPVEEEKAVPSEAPVVETTPTPEAVTVKEQSINVAEPSVKEEDNTPVTESTLPSGEQQTASPASVTEEGKSTQPSENAPPAQESTPVGETVAVSEDQDSLTLKIIVEVEPDQVPPTSSEESSSVVEQNTEVQSPAAEETLSSVPVTEETSPELQLPAAEETTSHVPEGALGDVKQTSSSSGTTIEPEVVLPASDKSEDVIPSKEKEQTPPSTDTGEKTLA